MVLRSMSKGWPPNETELGEPNFGSGTVAAITAITAHTACTAYTAYAQ